MSHPFYPIPLNAYDVSGVRPKTTDVGSHVSGMYGISLGVCRTPVVVCIKFS